MVEPSALDKTNQLNFVNIALSQIISGVMFCNLNLNLFLVDSLIQIDHSLLTPCFRLILPCRLLDLD